MNEKLNPFFRATREVFKLMLDLNLTRTAGGAENAADQKISIAIGLTGDISGKIVFLVPVKTSLEIVRIMSGMEIDALDGFVTSALGEMANIISGNAATYLSQENLSCDILPPQIELANKQDSPDAGELICLNTEAGGLCINLLLDGAQNR